MPKQAAESGANLHSLGHCAPACRVGWFKGHSTWHRRPGEGILELGELSLLGYTPQKTLERMPPAGEGSGFARYAHPRPGAWMCREQEFERFFKLPIFCCVFRAATSMGVPRDPVPRAVLRPQRFPPSVAVSPPLPPLHSPSTRCSPLPSPPLPSRCAPPSSPPLGKRSPELPSPALPSLSVPGSKTLSSSPSGGAVHSLPLSPPSSPGTACRHLAPGG